MEKLSFEIQINAIPEKVWSVLWDHTSYRQWTTAFTEGSFYEGTLDEGSIVKFFDPNNNGMYSQVEKNIPNEEIKFLHLGEIYDGVEVPQEWGEATEAYILEENEEGTKLRTEIQTPAEFKAFFEDKFPTALGIIKNLSENQL
ncbi:ATPase [Chryseobacterium sp. FH2]|uniref:SRPBCC domain-containing protein n=1 Tax=Chryseobacterium sp. FH2 TaxID=1674291 RepID=UPI00065AF1DC|nr:SRPBCC domain-containing protein [Chryseobacterium sp. FH2]KMQ68906.1 ATPase [Chryseobacterium sp. FH2]